MKYYFAPVQGHTDAAYRHFFAEEYDISDIAYTTPFIRLEKGEIRRKDLKDALSPLNAGLDVWPQVIFRDEEELRALVGLLHAEGIRKIDVNMGCPFPLQTSRGRGAATVGRRDCAIAVRNVVKDYPDVTFSVKMRLGFDGEEWEELIKMLNELPLHHITVHPRTARAQYTGPLSMSAFEAIYEMSANPLVYNGDILTPADAMEIMARYPRLHGIMIGRGLLGRPSLIKEISEGKEWTEDERKRKMKTFHRKLITYYGDALVGGDHQVLSKIQPFWEYAEAEIGRKAWKALKKASNMAKYQTALALI